MQGLQDLGFDGTRSVQGAVIPLALEGRDVVACAETGTGKTLAFAAPILQTLLSERPGYGDPTASHTRAPSILAPTRELAVQIEDALVGLTYHTPVSTAAVYGGVNMDHAGARTQGRRRYRRRDARAADGPHAARVDGFRPTPGARARRSRPHDGHGLLARRAAHPGGAAARAADAAVFGHPPRGDPQLVHDTLHAPRYVQVGANRGAARTIKHSIEMMPRANKVDWLAKFVRQHASGPVLVFVRTKIGADRVTRHLQAKNIRAAALHADRTQQERLQAVEGFRAGRHPVLVATDIAARGLDIEGIAHVVNFEYPTRPRPTSIASDARDDRARKVMRLPW